MRMREHYKEKMYMCFHKIANAALQDVQDNWTDLCIGYLYDARENEEFLLFVSKDEGKHWDNLVDEAFSTEEVYEGIFNCKEACEKLRQLCWKSGERWSSFSLRVLSDGRFDANFSYDDLPKVTRYSIQVWRGANLVC